MPIESTRPLRVSLTPPEEVDQRTTWTLALAGGEGLRLKEYIERRHGHGKPKQYCSLLGSRSMLEHTLGRLNQLTPASNTITVIGTNHRPYANEQLDGLSDHVFCQPSSRNTGVALFVALAMIRRWAPNATVIVTPTDHYVDPSARYLEHVGVALNVATRLRDRVVVLGVRPSQADADLGYLMPGVPLTEVPAAHYVTDFVEKPSLDHAMELVASGALWNTMVMCGTVDALWALGWRTEPHLLEILECLVPLVGTPDESDAIDYIYRAYPPVNFSSEMLARAAQQLAVIELDGVEWSDWGRSDRVEAVLAFRGAQALRRSLDKIGNA
jgi:mannose-1-phosphate guanylyltransferase